MIQLTKNYINSLIAVNGIMIINNIPVAFCYNDKIFVKNYKNLVMALLQFDIYTLVILPEQKFMSNYKAFVRRMNNISKKEYEYSSKSLY